VVAAIHHVVNRLRVLDAQLASHRPWIEISNLQAQCQPGNITLSLTDTFFGYVQDRGPGAGGPCYQWTRKVKAKTVSVALSREQYEALKEAIDNWHQTQEILQRMQALSRHVIFEMLPNPPRRKRLGKRVLGLI
jgi:hypothetical protein